MSSPESPPASLAAAASTGSRLATLRTLRDRLAVELDSCTSMRDIASLSQRLMDVLVQIDEMGGGVAEVKKGTPLDEFTKRLSSRQQSAATGSRRP